MKKKLTDDQIDQLLQKIVQDTAFDEAKVDEIADSPQLWWGVQRRIKADESAAANTGTGLFRRWLLLGASLSAAAVLLLFVLFAVKPSESTGEQVTVPQPQSLKSETSNGIGVDVKSVVNPANDRKAAVSIETASKPKNFVKTAVLDKKSPRPQQPKSKATVAKREPIEVKSEFIALSYARNPESGQIVRVKVPSSMMVSLGLVATVEKPNNLVNAELLVGDDGTTHAIRFIR